MKPKRERHVVAVVQLPPPVTGLSAVNSRVVEELSGAGLLYASVDIAPVGDGLKKLVSRTLRTMLAAAVLCGARLRGASVLYMPSDSASGIWLNIALLVLARALGFKVWIHHHNFSYIQRRYAPMALLLRLSSVGTRHIMLCDEMLNRFIDQYTGEWSGRGHEGVLLNNVFMISPVGRESTPPKLTIGHLSNLTVEKGSTRFIELFLSLARGGVLIDAILAGPIGDTETEDAIAAASGEFPHNFSWIGPVYGPDKTAFYQSIDAFVFPSRYANEAQPLVLIEALAHGAAVITTQRGCMGCDHADSPGLTAPESEFSNRAASWLREHESAASRSGLADLAAARFAQLTGQVEGQLDNILTQIKGVNPPPPQIGR